MNRVMGFSLALAVCCAHAEYRQDDSVMSDAYWEIWNPEVQKKIDDDIAKYRMADAKVVLEDAVEGDEVSVEQVSHAFFFGAHIFNYNQLGKREFAAEVARRLKERNRKPSAQKGSRYEDK